MARITRKELKTDKFALEVEHTFTFVEEHRKEIARYGAIALVVALLIVAFLFYQRRQHATREVALTKAIQVQEAPVGPPGQPGSLSFPTQEAKDQEALKVFGEIRAKYSGSVEAQVAQYYTGAIIADQGKLAEAEKAFLDVAGNADADYAALAKLALAQIYFADGRTDQGEKTLRELIAKPTMLVSQDQATISLARALMRTKPAEARKLLEPLRTKVGEAGQVALTLYSELPPQ